MDAHPLKIDVEGFEVPVLRGARSVLASPALLGAVVELIGNGAAHGHSEEEAHRILLDAGLHTVRYDPFARRLDPTGDRIAEAGNTIYVRDLATVATRVREARTLRWGLREL